MSSEFSFINETLHTIQKKLETNTKRQIEFKKEFNRQNKLYRKKIMKAMPNNAKERTQKLIKERYFFDDLMMGPPPKNKKLLRLNQFKRKSNGYIYDVPPLIDIFGRPIRNDEEEYIKTCITTDGLTEKGKEDLKLPEHWTEHILSLENNPDNGKTYFVNIKTNEICIDKLPPNSNKLCGVVFNKFHTCFTQYPTYICTLKDVEDFIILSSSLNKTSGGGVDDDEEEEWEDHDDVF